ncbi:type II toxin-antitoxin system HicB family antitoxin [bacterium]|nr:type II toxin-antitoxin system HicB family antitoxin [bacterium]
MKSYFFKVVIEEDLKEDGTMAYSAYCPALEDCITWGYTFEEAKENIKDAIEFYVECLLEDGEPFPVEAAALDKPHRQLQGETTVSINIDDTLAKKVNIQQLDYNKEPTIRIIVPRIHMDDTIPPKTLQRINKQTGLTEETLNRFRQEE